MKSRKVDKSEEEQRAEASQLALAQWVCYSKLAPQAVISDSFKRLMRSLNPNISFKFETLESNCLKLFEEEQLKVKDAFSKHGGQISLSVDVLYDQTQYQEYLCLSAQFIDDDWKLRNWVISYCCDNGEDMFLITEAILKSLKEYNIESKVLTLTVGGDTDLADVVKEGIHKEKLPMNSQLFHVQCGCDIISRMVQIGLEEIDKIIDKVKLLSWSKSLPLWYLTTFKLSEALQLQEMGEFSSVKDDGFYELPSKEEWEKVRNMCKISDRIYEIVERLFEQKRPTPNLFLPHFQEIRAYLNKESSSSDEFVSFVAKKMLDFFNKYWDDTCLVLSSTAFLDPRYKMKFIEFCPSDSRGTTYLDNIRKVYDSYVMQCDQKEYVLSDSSSDSEDDEEEIEEEETEEGSETHAKKKPRDILENLSLLKEYCQAMESSENDKAQKTEFDMYLEEPIVPWKGNFSVLHWWKDNCTKYPQLSRMARDFLAIPMSVATSYDAYYTEQREPDSTLLSLKPGLMNALKCTRSWKLGAIKHK
ncbi:hypothetical protein SOVF_169320 [Spinacia oleracea]|uniref:Zinc finger BED domain-containing protein RICESLEEPER 2 n=1 Tax=Spinacia oleracea TaxID=3562 RepID=A0A9R0I8K9_SPIOL|nr:zinc finger BED domain-containing protein RICESLEEPER 2-like [Spinacia oleracea]KNA07717.1 hypothetical protein SOVF_169320 [Spinacia oleracea]